MNRLKVGDLVQVMTGRERGKTGRISRILSKENRVIVEGLNKVIRHTRPNQENVEGGRLEKEAPIHISNVMPVDAESGKPTRVKFVTTENEGVTVKSRVAISGAELKQA
jgi:large subunit ribosomal protein L24